MLNLKDKQNIITEIKKMAEDALSVVVADTCGITANLMTKLRKEGRESGVNMYIVRNTLIRRIVENTPFECLKDTFIGSTLIAFSNEHPGTAARIFKAFSKENIQFKIKSAAFENKVIPESQIDYLATMPTYKEAIEKIILIIREASIDKLIRTLHFLCNKKKMK